MTGFGKILRAKRLELHLSQEALAAALGISPRSISRWEQERSIPQVHYQLQLSHFFSVKLDDIFAHTKDSSPHLLSDIPFSHNPYFYGREDILSALHQLLTIKQPATLPLTSALSGLGGIGKTQVAIEYAYRHRREYSAILWIAANTFESLTISLQQIAEQLQFPGNQIIDQEGLSVEVKKWLANHTGWLLIVDAIEDLDLLQKVLPPVRPGAILFTTRRLALGSLATTMKLPVMSIQEGIALLLSRAGLPQNSQQLPDTLLDASLSSAAELVALLGGLPLALDQAGAYIEESECSITDYLQRYRDQRKLVLARRGNHGGAHPASVSTTLRLSVEQAEQGHPAAAELLRICAFLDSEAIPEELLMAGAPFLGPVLGPIGSDPYQFDLIVAALRNISLVTRNPQTHTFSVHRLVQAVLLDQMEPEEVSQRSQTVVRMVNAAFPPEAPDTWDRCERLLAQALVCVPLIEQNKHDLPEAHELLYKLGNYLRARGYFEDEILS